MRATVSPADRAVLRSLITRSFDSAETAAAEVCRVVREALDADLVFASRLDCTEVELVAVEDRTGSGFAVGTRVPADVTFCARVLDGRGPQTSPDLADGPYADLAWPRELGLRSYAMTPLWDADGTAHGALSAMCREPRVWTDDELTLLELLGGLLVREQQMARVRAAEAAHAAQLAASERRYRELVDDLGDIVVETDVTGRMTYVNRAFTDLVGMAVDGEGWDMMAYVHPEDRVIADEQFAAALAGADTMSQAAAREVRFVVPGQKVRWMSVRGRPLTDDGGGFAGLRGILHDVTVRVESEQQVRAALAQAEAALAEVEAARDEAERASRAKSDFLSRMSHELRTPMNAILGFGQLLELAELSGEDAENVEQILRAGRHLLELINEVLDVVRIESGTLALSIEPVEVGQVLSESLDLVRVAASDRGLTVRTPDRLNGAMVVADRQRLKQVLVNLLSNAVKYNREHGLIEVTWRPRPPDPTRDDAPEQGWLRVEVRDTGTGIPAEHLDDVFTPFERLGAEGTGVEGSGVGLSLTRTLVEAQGGRIGVVSELGVGSTFWVDLPAAPPVAAAPSAALVEPTHTVLYVEDNPSNIMLVRRVLARRPHVRLVVVQDGAEALTEARRVLPDLVLLDLHLPGVHGAEVLAALRAAEEERLREVPVVVVTADLTEGVERRMLDAGATLFLPKPIDVHALLVVVDERLPVR